jgi:hypothetical protein
MAAEDHEVTLTDPLAGLRNAVFALVPAVFLAVITHLVDVHPMAFAWMPATFFAALGDTLAEAAVIPSVTSAATAPATASSFVLNKGFPPGGRAGGIARPVSAAKTPSALPPRHVGRGAQIGHRTGSGRPTLTAEDPRRESSRITSRRRRLSVRAGGVGVDQGGDGRGAAQLVQAAAPGRPDGADRNA